MQRCRGGDSLWDGEVSGRGLGSGCECEGKKWMRCLHYVAMSNSVRVARLLLRFGADVNALTDLNCAVVHLAARYGGLRFMEMLCDAGADLHVSSMFDGSTALVVAVTRNRCEIVRFLLRDWMRSHAGEGARSIHEKEIRIPDSSDEGREVGGRGDGGDVFSNEFSKIQFFERYLLVLLRAFVLWWKRVDLIKI